MATWAELEGSPGAAGARSLGPAGEVRAGRMSLSLAAPGERAGGQAGSG